ncbi:unnamed protein product [Macrosiphum euphorbiae]|uniref:GATA-type domain-containing protein n=1 Tax=Macrosiphum euphorbiae TaxID=13131 RepID=A0AAV0XXT9_9HEMI|nr:unnamed protein product [Macrosiphum euphorbiae]
MMSTRSPTLYQMFSLYHKVDKGESLFNNQLPSLPEKIYLVFGASGTSKHRRKQSCPSRTLKLSDSRTQIAGDDTNSSDEVNVTNWTPKKIRANSPAVKVNPAYVWPNLQGSFQTRIFQTKNPGGTTSELRPQAMQIGEWANNQGQSNALTDPSDRMGMLLFGATHVQGLSAKSNDGQSPGTPKGATVVRGKLVSSEEKRKIYQTQATIRGYSDGHQVQHEVKDINTSPKKHRKPTARESSVQRMCFNCGTTCSTVWRRLNEGTVCNACGLYYRKYGKIRPPTMRRDTIYTRQRRKRSDNGMDISMNKKKIKIKKTEDIKLEEDCYEVKQPQSHNSTAVQTIIEESVQDEMPLNLVVK